MLSLLLLALFAILHPTGAQEAGQRAGRCVIEGRVVVAGTDQGLKKVRVSLSSYLTVFQRPTSADVPQGGLRFAVTDEQGRFQFEDVPAGDYALGAERIGFVAARDSREMKGRGARYLTLKAGDHLTEVTLAMLPAGVIYGRVYDPDGDVVPGVSVQALGRDPLGRNADWSPGQYTDTNDLGEFRLFGLAPGRYFLVAQLHDYRADVFRSRKDETGQSGIEEVAPVYYPGVVNPARAEAIEVKAGQEVRVTLTLRTVRTYTIRGRVTPLPESESRSIEIHAAPADGGNLPSSPRGYAQVDDRTGEFEVAGMPPGSYYIFAVEIEAGDGETGLGRSRVEVGSHDVNDVLISLSSGSEISGRIRFEGAQPADKSGWMVDLRPDQDEALGNRSAYASAKEDGSFKLKRVYDGVYWPFAGSRQHETYYIKSARVGNVDCLRQPLRVMGGNPGPLDIVMAKGTAILSGTVRDRGGDVVPGAVILVMDENAANRKTFTRIIQTDINGAFRIDGLPPGNFFVLAVEAIDPEGSPWSVDFEHIMNDLSKRVHLEPMGSATVELNLTSLRE